MSLCGTTSVILCSNTTASRRCVFVASTTSNSSSITLSGAFGLQPLDSFFHDRSNSRRKSVNELKREEEEQAVSRRRLRAPNIAELLAVFSALASESGTRAGQPLIPPTRPPRSAPTGHREEHNSCPETWRPDISPSRA